MSLDINFMINSSHFYVGIIAVALLIIGIFLIRNGILAIGIGVALLGLIMTIYELSNLYSYVQSVGLTVLIPTLLLVFNAKNTD
jgi:hypothetical protein